MSIKDILNDDEKVRKLAKVAFDLVDTDGNGYIDRDELEKVMNTIGSEMDFDGASKEDVDEIIKELDTKDESKLG